MKEQNICQFSDCPKKIKEWESYCDEHKKFINNVLEALECAERDRKQAEYDKENNS